VCRLLHVYAYVSDPACLFHPGSLFLVPPSSCAVKRNSSSSTETSQTFTWWTSPTSGSVYQVLDTLTSLCLCDSCDLWNVPFFSFVSRFVMSPDKDQDGEFKWIDKSPITFSNYGPNWPQNTADSWDCGQIYTGRNGHSGILALNILVYVFSWRPTSLYLLLQETMQGNGKQPTAIRAWASFVRWRADRTPNRLQLPVSQTSRLLFTPRLEKDTLTAVICFVCFRFPLWRWIFVVRRLLLSIWDRVGEKLAWCRGSLQQRAGPPRQRALRGGSQFHHRWAAKKKPSGSSHNREITKSRNVRT